MCTLRLDFSECPNGVACRPFIVYWVIRVIRTRLIRVVLQGHPDSETNKRPQTDCPTYPNPKAFFPPNYFLEQFHSNCEDTEPSKLSNLNIYKASEIVLLFEQIGLASKRTFKKTVIPMTAVQ